MKKLYSFLLALLITASLSAQTPSKMSYQAVIRNSSNQLVTNHAVGMKISILAGSTTGTVVYTETQTPNTNDNGLVNIEIGGGAGFNSINWAGNSFFIKIETDPTGSTNYTITSTSQLLTVPYALHAKTAEALSGIIVDGSETKITAGTNVTVTGAGTTASPYLINSTAGGGGTHYLGEEYLGGIIFYLYTDNTGTQKGLIVSKTESTATWGGSTLVNANNISDGAYNMALMPTGVGTARTWVETLGAGWYLPSIDELGILLQNRFHVDNSSASGLTLLSRAAYWSSTEYDANYAFYVYFDDGGPSESSKAGTGSVRAVRRF